VRAVPTLAGLLSDPQIRLIVVASPSDTHFELASAALAAGKHVVVDDVREKGQAEEVKQFVQAVKTGGSMPIPVDEILESTRATLAVLESMRTGRPVEL